MRSFHMVFTHLLGLVTLAELLLELFNEVGLYQQGLLKLGEYIPPTNIISIFSVKHIPH